MWAALVLTVVASFGIATAECEHTAEPAELFNLISNLHSELSCRLQNHGKNPVLSLCACVVE